MTAQVDKTAQLPCKSDFVVNSVISSLVNKSLIDVRVFISLPYNFFISIDT